MQLADALKKVVRSSKPKKRVRRHACDQCGSTEKPFAVRGEVAWAGTLYCSDCRFLWKDQPQ